MIPPNFIYSCFLMCIGHIGFWLSHNSQFVWHYWSDKPILSNLCFGFPGAVVFWYGVKYLMEDMEALWSVRFVGFATSYLVFPVMTWVLMNETPFTVKTGICFLLSIAIVCVQVFMK
tara:strand:- start:239 stop:589 length:351 start_codon:yes stop_codon:yes gene_type:complete